MSIEIIGDYKFDNEKEGQNAFQEAVTAYNRAKSIDELRQHAVFGIRLEMERYLDLEDGDIKSVGYFLKKLLTLYEVPAAKYASFVGLEKSNLYAILAGRRRMNAILAKKTALTFGISESLWLFVETKNRLAGLNGQKDINESDYSLEQLLAK